MEELKLFIVLVLLMSINTVAGTAYANITKVFNKDIFKQGLWKLFALALCFGGLTIIAVYSPDVQIGDINAVDLLPLILYLGIALYGAKVATIMKSLIGIKVSESTDK